MTHCILQPPVHICTLAAAQIATPGQPALRRLQGGRARHGGAAHAHHQDRQHLGPFRHRHQGRLWRPPRRPHRHGAPPSSPPPRTSCDLTPCCSRSRSICVWCHACASPAQRPVCQHRRSLVVTHTPRRADPSHQEHGLQHHARQALGREQEQVLHHGRQVLGEGYQVRGTRGHPPVHHAHHGGLPPRGRGARVAERSRAADRLGRCPWGRRQRARSSPRQLPATTQRFACTSLVSNRAC